MSETIKFLRRCVWIRCTACNGTGQSRYHEYRDCDNCDGKGRVLTYVELRP